MTGFYYDNTELLSRNKLFNFVIGNRGGGKTYNAKRWCINDYLKRGKQFVWVRRYKQELKKVGQFFADIAAAFPDHELEVKGKQALIDGKVAGWFVNLSTASQEKSVSYPNVNKIVFDEFIIDKGAVRYLTNEVECFLEFYETVARLRDDVRAVFLANNVSVVNPYFLYFGVMPKPGQRFTSKGQVLIEMVANQEFISAKYNTRFGQLIRGTTYAQYAVENEALRDNDDFVEQKPDTAHYRGTISYKGKYYGIWWELNKGLMYISTRANLEGGRAYAITKDDHTPNTLLLKSQSRVEMLRILKEAFSLGLVRYDSITTKNQMYEVMSLLNIK